MSDSNKKPKVTFEQLEQWLELVRNNQNEQVIEEMEDFLGTWEKYSQTRIRSDKR